MIKNILFDMGGVIFLQDTAEAFRRFRKAGINPDVYMGEYGQKDFFLDIETGRIDTGEFCRRMAAALGRDSVSYAGLHQGSGAVASRLSGSIARDLPPVSSHKHEPLHHGTHQEQQVL